MTMFEIKKGVRLVNKNDATLHTVGEMLHYTTDADGNERRFWAVFADADGLGRRYSEEVIPYKFDLLAPPQETA